MTFASEKIKTASRLIYSVLCQIYVIIKSFRFKHLLSGSRQSFPPKYTLVIPDFDLDLDVF